MHTTWTDSKGLAHRQVAPLSLVISSFSPVADVSLTLTPDLKDVTRRHGDAEGENNLRASVPLCEESSTCLVYVDLGHGAYRLGGGATTIGRGGGGGTTTTGGGGGGGVI